MSSSAFVGFFTLGVPPNRYNLPHRPIGTPVILLISRVISRALGDLRKQGFNVCDAKEDQLTAALRSVIENDLRQKGTVPGFNRHFYEPVFRQSQVANYDGTKLMKAPDLCFKLRLDEKEKYTGLSEFDALFVECKPVDDSHSVASKYCDDGLIRFVNGDYAWAMQEGMMVAYARHGRTLTDHLIPAMNDNSRIASLATEELPKRLAVDRIKDHATREPIHVSLHRRGFPWPDKKGLAPNITVFHVWFNCN
jgi:hypothetical protein